MPANEESLKKIADTNKTRFEAITPLPRTEEALVNRVLTPQIEQIK